MEISPQVLLTMPLHAVTEMYGEAGLRRRFELEVERFAPADRAVLLDAMELAAQLHSDDRRTREPYLNHPLRTTIRIICYYQVDDVDVLVASLLHDTVEDHPEDLAPSGLVPDALAALAARYGARVAELVAAVTNPAREPGRDRHEQYREHVAESLEANPWARVIKASDFTDNGVGVLYSTPAKQHSAATKYAPLVPVFRDLIARADTPLTDDVKAHILEQLDAAEERFGAILSA
jgi:(p)ppGpp synthase/HD superfamily hydrolase